MKKEKVSIFWFRRDLRLEDNHGLYQALSGEYPVVPVFIFDTDILAELPQGDHRVTFIHKTLVDLNTVLIEKYNTRLETRHDKTLQAFQGLLGEYDVQNVYTNHDYEPYAKKRDTEIANYLAQQDIKFKTYKDQVIFEKNDVTKDDGLPYVVYTPYMKKWKARFSPVTDLPKYDSLKSNYFPQKPKNIIALKDMGFVLSDIKVPDMDTDIDILNRYTETRDIPSLEDGTTHVGTYLRFGLISIRRLMQKAITAQTDTYMNELIWREFFMQVIFHFPYSATRSFREKYDFVPWRNDEDEFEKWKNGMTGYPMVDAGMRELNQTGYMHNRVRMVVASFLCKHLLIDWRWGEQYFAEKLFDYELSSNVGNWQWAAGSGVDAAPYFRVFNPETQFKKFDPKGTYVRKWVPEYFGIGYVEPVVDHKMARERAIETYKTALNNFEK